MAALIGLVLATVALALAWLLYRLERLHARHRDLDGALAVVRGVKRGMVERVGNDVGWAEHYFTTVYTAAPGDPEVQSRVEAAHKAVMDGTFGQVYPVPLAPLELLLSSPATGGLISDELVFIANVGLWRVQIFNQFVRMQADFNARFMPEISDGRLDPARRKALAQAAAAIADMLNRWGVGEANVQGGWYARLKRALDADINELREKRARGFFDYARERRWLLVGDLTMAALVAASIVTLGVRVIYELS
jgi:hypothetical protein